MGDRLGGSADDYVAGILRGDRRSIARAISAVENETATGRAILRNIQRHLGRAQLIGITGAPGAGKSTLVSALIGEFLGRGRSVGVVAVDPSSPFSGGAILGDRIRMERHSLAERTFIRSLATRGHSGGLSRAVVAVVDVLDAAGFDLIIVETVGVGQSEVEIAEIADTRIVVCPPGLGDDVQAIKAGILEIADILVVSKADLPLADKTELDLRFMLSVRDPSARQPAIVRVSSVASIGITELADSIDARRDLGVGKRGIGSRARMRRLFAQEAANLLRRRMTSIESPALDALCDAVACGDIDHEQASLQAMRLVMEGCR
ncbi:MAG: methylmalonyl Co-A mutase-associated GTPase MeaB [Burkholderiales bacterium]|nr:methylmalonyl Co-A mutase-associated GTPase MeaB [Burkholderiales bacterium]